MEFLLTLSMGEFAFNLPFLALPAPSCLIHPFCHIDNPGLKEAVNR